MESSTSKLAKPLTNHLIFSSSRDFLRAADRSMIHLFIAACYTPWLLLRFHSPFAENICKAVSSFPRIVKVSSEKYFQVWICALVCMIAQNMPINLRIAQNESFVIGSYLMLGVMPGTFLCAFAVSQNSSIF